MIFFILDVEKATGGDAVKIFGRKKGDGEENKAVFRHRLSPVRKGKKKEKEQKQQTETAKALPEELSEETITENLYIQGNAAKPDSLNVAAASLIGSRKNQQDSLCYQWIPEKGFLAAVCDGMGGLGGGELASYTACMQLFEAFRKSPETAPVEFFMETAPQLDASVAGLTDADGVSLGAGTTLVAVWIKEGRLYWLSVGDSKLYLVRQQKARCLTTPHNYRMLLEKRKQAHTITPERYEEELCRGEALVSYIGMNGLKYMDISVEGLLLEEGDQIVLCSDGFYRQCPEEELAQQLESLTGEYETFAAQLAERVIRNQPRKMDNTTLILIRYSPKEEQKEEENITKGENEI